MCDNNQSKDTQLIIIDDNQSKNKPVTLVIDDMVNFKNETIENIFKNGRHIKIFTWFGEPELRFEIDSICDKVKDKRLEIDYVCNIVKDKNLKYEDYLGIYQ